jgi:hypothetical protein
MILVSCLIGVVLSYFFPQMRLPSLFPPRDADIDHVRNVSVPAGSTEAHVITLPEVLNDSLVADHEDANERIEHEPVSDVRAMVEHGTPADCYVQNFEHEKLPGVVFCIKYRAFTCAKLLISHGANVNACGPDGITPLMAACDKGAGSLVKLLTTHGADLRHTDAEGRTPLHYIAGSDLPDSAIRLVLVKGAALEARDHAGHTPLMEAVLSGEEGHVRALLRAGARIGRSTGGNTVLATLRRQMRDYCPPAQKSRYTRIARLLRRYGFVG